MSSQPPDNKPGEPVPSHRAIAHDLNNVLTAIGNSLQLMRLRIQRGQTDGLDRYIDLGEDNVRKAAALTAQLHEIARRDGGEAA